MQVAICGGGIGGLGCAIALQAQGLKADVYESAPFFAPVGAGITLAYNAMQVMKKLGLDQAITAQGHRLRVATISDQQLNPLTSNTLDEIEAEFGVPFIGITRRNLHEILVSALPPESLHLGKTLQRYQSDSSKIIAHFSDGTTQEADLLVCADGIRSVGRGQMFPHVKTRYAGQTSWRGLVQASGIEIEPGQALEAWGPGTRMGALHVGPDTLYWFAVANRPAGENPEAHHKGDLRNLLKPYHPKLQTLLERTPEGSILRTDIWDLPSLPAWNDGRAVLLGDAAHATTPNLGQGAAQALEDAYCLALCLAKFEPDLAISNYRQWRHQKAQWVVDMSRRFGWVGGWSHPLAVGLRNYLLSKTPPAQGLKSLRQISRLDWLD